MKPTDEQLEALRLFATGDSLAIEAGAGTGKTSTLVLLAESAGDRRGQYIAFNKALVEDGRGKFPSDTVSANTAHSLAFRALGHKFGKRLRSSARMTGREVASRLSLDALAVEDFDGKSKVLAPGFLAGLCSKAVRSFCQSADQTLGEWHFPVVDGLDPIEGDRRVGDSNRYVRRELLPFARAMWADLQNEYGWVPYQHDHYLKAWQLSNPRVDVSYVMFDEAQDANPVIAAIVAAQGDHAQLVYVGDSQQEIYSFTGAVNALAQVKTVHRTYLTQSFRFGQEIADVANEILDELKAPLRLSGNPAIDSRVEALGLPDSILTRTNAVGIRKLLELLTDGDAVHMIGGASDTIAFCEAARDLQTLGHTQHPELAVFGSWLEVQAYVDQEAEGEDLRLMVRLIDEFTPDEIIRGLKAMVPEDRAEVVISTAHKSKGRQWPTVQLAPDFKRPKDKESDGERRLLYVAVTRAQNILDREALNEDERPIEPEVPATA